MKVRLIVILIELLVIVVPMIVFYLRINWVSRNRLKVLNKVYDDYNAQVKEVLNAGNLQSKLPEWPSVSDVLPTFDYMFWHFWIWDIKKFYKSEWILKRL